MEFIIFDPFHTFDSFDPGQNHGSKQHDIGRGTDQPRRNPTHLHLVRVV